MTDSDILINDLEQGSRVRWAPGQHLKRPLKVFKVERTKSQNQRDNGDHSNICICQLSGHFIGHKSMLVGRG